VPLELRDVTEMLDAAARDVERQLDRRLDVLQQAVHASRSARDELERAIGDVDDERSRHQLHRLLGELDGRLADVVDRAEEIGVSDLFDPIRVVRADLQLDARR
jgi:hypothetical protein